MNCSKYTVLSKVQVPKCHTFQIPLTISFNRTPRVVVVAAIIQTLDSLHLKCPEVSPDKLKELAAARAALVK
jgi:hypothetical protein